MIHQLGQKGHKKISNKLPIIGISAVVVILLGVIFMTTSKHSYKINNEEMLEEVLTRKDVIRPEKFMEIIYSNDSLYQFIDLRSAPEYLNDHIEGAIHIPIHKILSDEYKDILKQDERINVLYYSDQCGACGPWMILKQIGYKNNMILQGGYDYVKANILDNYSPMSGNYSSEKARFDYAKVMSETAGPGTIISQPKETNSVAIPVVKPKKESAEEEGGC